MIKKSIKKFISIADEFFQAVIVILIFEIIMDCIKKEIERRKK